MLRLSQEEVVTLEHALAVMERVATADLPDDGSAMDFWAAGASRLTRRMLLAGASAGYCVTLLGSSPGL